MAKTKVVIKDFFFDRPELQRKIGKAKARNMNYFGGFVRRTARNSMKKAPATRTKSGKRKKLTKYGRYRRIKSGKRTQEEGVQQERYSAIRFQKGLHSPPGTPPYYHGASGNKNLRTIIYQYSPEADQVDVFTQPLNAQSKSTTPVPILHEAGGVSKTRYQKTARRYAKRPFMQPAGEKGLVKFRKRIKDGIK